MIARKKPRYNPDPVLADKVLASQDKAEKPAEPADPYVQISRIEEGVFEKLRAELRDADDKLESLRIEGLSLAKLRASTAAKVALIEKAINGALEAMPYDDDLRSLLKRCKGWDELKRNGASDAQIAANLKRWWPTYVGGGADPTRCFGGGVGPPQVWIDAPGWNATPTLKGDALVREARRVLEIPLPGKGKIAGGSGTGGTKPKPKAKSKPAPAPRKPGIPSNRPFRGGLAVAAKAFEKRAAKKPKPAKHSLPVIAEAEASAPTAEKTARPNLFEIVGRNRAAKTHGQDARATGTPAAVLGFTHEQLDAALSRKLRPHEGDGGVIGDPLIDKGHKQWAVVGGTVGSEELTYRLYPASHKLDLSRDVSRDTWKQRRERFATKAPEDVALGGLRVVDGDGDWWILGDDRDAITVTVPMTPEVRAAMARAAGGDEAGVAAFVRLGSAVEIERLMEDPNVNRNGVYVKGVQSINIGLRKPDHVSLQFAKGNDGKFRGAYQCQVHEWGGSGPVTVHGQAFDSAAGALQHAGGGLLEILQRYATGEKAPAAKGRYTAAANMLREFLKEDPIAQVNPLEAGPVAQAPKLCSDSKIPIVPPGMERRKPNALGRYADADRIVIPCEGDSLLLLEVALGEDGYWNGCYYANVGTAKPIGSGDQEGPSARSEGFTTRARCLLYYAGALRSWLLTLLDGMATPKQATAAQVNAIARDREIVNGLLDQVVEFRDARRCRVCGCSDMEAEFCIERTGKPCDWVGKHELCSACVGVEPGSFFADESESTPASSGIDWVARMKACKTADEARELFSVHEQHIATLACTIGITPPCGKVDAGTLVGFSVVRQNEWRKAINLAKKKDPIAGAEFERWIEAGHTIHGKMWDKLYANTSWTGLRKTRAKPAKVDAEPVESSLSTQHSALSTFSDDEAVDPGTVEKVIDNPGRVVLHIGRRGSGRFAYRGLVYVGKAKLTMALTGNYASRADAIAAGIGRISDFVDGIIATGGNSRSQKKEIARALDALEKSLLPASAAPPASAPSPPANSVSATFCN